MSKVYVILGSDGKIDTFFSGPQDVNYYPNIKEINTSDQVYVDYCNSLNFWDVMGMPKPE